MGDPAKSGWLQPLAKRRLLTGIGAALVAAGVLLLGGWYSFQWRSVEVGRALVAGAQERFHGGSLLVRPLPAGPRWWLDTFGGPNRAEAVLEIPALQLTAPVEEGVGDAVLNVAVGHLPSSVRPGAVGTSILAAHNATWFRNIDRLKAGDRIEYLTASGTLQFQVTGARKVHVGTPVYNSGKPSLVLESCYPLDALYLTPERYLVTASLASVQPAKAPNAVAKSETVRLRLPPALSPDLLRLSANKGPEGALTESGHPASAWLESTAPLVWTRAATSLYFAVVRTAAARRADWLQVLDPGLSQDALRPLWGGQVETYRDPLDIRIAVEGSTVTAVTLRTTFAVRGSSDPGVYRVVMKASANGSELELAGWNMVSTH